MTDTVLTAVDARGVATITLNRPERLNAVNWETAERAAQILRDVVEEAVLADRLSEAKQELWKCRLDLATGERPWTSDAFGKYVSLVAQGNRILGLDERGILLLIEADTGKG